MKLFDSPSLIVRSYLHLSYALSMVFIILYINSAVIAFHHGTAFDFFSMDFLLSLLIGTVMIALMLYLHLPKMIDRCFNIGRKFGL